MLTISILGPGNTQYYYQQLEKIPPTKLEKQVLQIAKALQETNSKIEFLADKGIAFDIALKYKELGGKKVISTNPLSDKVVGIKHLEPYLNYKVGNKKLIDKLIDSGDWAKHNQLKGLFGDVILYLGKTLGTDLELNNAAYIYKWHHNNKKYPLKLLHKEIKTGKNFPMTVLVYSPFLKSRKFEYETESYLKKEKINLIYINSANELKREIEKLKNNS